MNKILTIFDEATNIVFGSDYHIIFFFFFFSTCVLEDERNIEYKVYG
jgi:hypothetical protein